MYTEELPELKIKSGGKSQLGWGKAMEHYQGKEIAFSAHGYQRHSFRPR